MFGCALCMRIKPNIPKRIFIMLNHDINNSDQLENYIIWILVALVAAIVIASMLYFMFFSFNYGYPHPFRLAGYAPTITISASGSASAKPAQATVDLVMNGTGMSTAAALQNLSSTLNQFNTTIKNYVNGNFSLVTTTYFNIYPRINYTYNTTSRMYTSYKSGYVATEDISVVIPNINNVSNVVDSLSSISNIYVSSINQELSNVQTQSLRQEALSAALSNATAQAQALAGGANIAIRNITETSFYYAPLPIRFATQSSESSIANYYGGTSTVTETISVVFYKT